MKLALLSDLHANLPAFQACLAHARALGATGFALLGDLVGYGPHPGPVVDLAMELAGQGAVVLRGNHEEAALEPPPDARTAEAVSAAWTHDRLNDAQRRFLAQAPLTAEVHGCLLVHASAHQPSAWHYVASAVEADRCLQAAHGAARVFCGHVHAQRLFYRGRGRDMMAFEPVAGVAVPLGAHRQWVATIGSVGQPRDGDPRAMYALLDLAHMQLVFHRVAYDHHATAQAVRTSGLPAAFADRLEQGR